VPVRLRSGVAGADALVVVPRSRARGGRIVEVPALETLANRNHQEGDGLETGLAELGPRLWQRAGRGPEDMDLVSVYDDYTVMVLIQLADLGFIPNGDVARFVERELDRRAINTSGGQLSAGQAGIAGSLHGVVEVVRQLLGQVERPGVERPRTAVVTGYGMALYRYCGVGSWTMRYGPLRRLDAVSSSISADTRAAVSG
jgi:acetyl-CoA acetyltransferase